MVFCSSVRPPSFHRHISRALAFLLTASVPAAGAFQTSAPPIAPPPAWPPPLADPTVHGPAVLADGTTRNLAGAAVASVPSPYSMALSHSRRLQTSVRSVAELTRQLANPAVSRILLAAGTYTFSSAMCYTYRGSALCISRSVTIEAAVPGTVVLNAQGSSSSTRRVMDISAGTVTLIGLNITGGYKNVRACAHTCAHACCAPVMFALTISCVHLCLCAVCAILSHLNA